MADMVVLQSILWPGAELGDWRRRSATSHIRMIAVPTSNDVHQLLPWRASSIVATALRMSDDRSARRRLRDSIGAAGLLTIGAVSRSRRVGITSGRSLIEHVAGCLNQPTARGVVLCGPQRANQKPVVHLHDSRGRTIAFVKVAINDLTRRLLDDEDAALVRLASIHDKGFRVPPVLARGTFEGAAWLALGPLNVERRRRPDLTQIDALATAIERTGTRWEGRSGDSPFLTRLTAAARGLTAAEAVVAGLTERWAEHPLTLSGGHGDFVPWNLLSGSPQPSVWDWERYQDQVPIGFDRIHYRTQIGLHRNRESLRTAVGMVADHVDDVLPELARHQRQAHLEWYLADLLCRYERDAGDQPTLQLASLVRDLTEILTDILKGQRISP
jgi:hypothetical protein